VTGAGNICPPPQSLTPSNRPPPQRRPSLMSHQSYCSQDDSIEERCPYLECGGVFKDMKAHMLTHQNERPYKCPIATCDYHIKGFARNYDKNRHYVNHFKGNNSVSASRRPRRKSTLTEQQKNRKRQWATEDQLLTLEVKFNKNHNPTTAVKEDIARDINMTERSVQTWFQNRYVL
jgi:Homeodomain